MLFDFVTLKLIWWVLVAAVLVLYATTAGYDFGVTLLMPFLKRRAKFSDNDAERRVILNTIAPTWDGNQTWLVFAGGALFVIWPSVYAATFSGLYALMLFILWSFFLRPPGFDYRSKLTNPTWRKAWDWGLFISAFFPVLAFGLGIGNLFIGLPISYDAFSLRSFYHGNFLDLLNIFGVLCALASLFMCLMHGTAHLNRRTEGELRCVFRRLHRMFSIVFLLLLTLGWLMLALHVNGYDLGDAVLTAGTQSPMHSQVHQAIGLWLVGLHEHPWKWLGPILAYVGVVMAIFTARLGNGSLGFLCSAVGVAGTVLTAVFALFPFIVPSSLSPSESLTIWNATSSQYTLMGMLYISVVMLVIIFAYKLWGFSAVWRHKKALSVDDVRQHEHTFY